MFCKNCGKELVDGAAFCAYCGTAAKAAETQEADKDVSITGQAQAQAQEPSHKRSRTVGIAVAIAVAAMVAAVGIFAFVQHRAYEEAHAAIAVTVNTKIPDHEGDGGTGVPLAVDGVDQAKTDEIAKQVTAARKTELDRIAEEQRKAEEERQRREEEERKRAEAEAAARRDNLTGTYFCNGKGAPNTATITFSGHEVTVAGTLNKKGGGSAGNKTWTFADTDDTWYGGYAQGPGYIEYSRDEFESHSSVGNFPGITIELENGVVKRMVISS